MVAYKIFSIADTDHFIPAKFPQVEASIQKLVERLSNEPAIKIEMLLSFVKDHSIELIQVEEHPQLAALISTQSLPLGLMEALFDASRQNAVFKTELEAHIRHCFNHTITPDTSQL